MKQSEREHEIWSVCIVVLLNSGIFSETAWRAILSHQAAQPFEHVLWSFWVQRLAVNPCTTMLLKVPEHSGFLLINCLAVMNFRQATRV